MADGVRELIEKDRVIDAINRLFICTDRRDWAGSARCWPIRS